MIDSQKSGNLGGVKPTSSQTRGRWFVSVAGSTVTHKGFVANHLFVKNAVPRIMFKRLARRTDLGVGIANSGMKGNQISSNYQSITPRVREYT